MALLAVCASTVVGSTRPAFGAPATSVSISTLNAQIAAVGQALSSLEQAAQAAQIAETAYRANAKQAGSFIGRDVQAVVQDKAQLQRTAINDFVDNGTADATNPLFVADPNQLGAASVYAELAEGNLSGSVATLTNAEQTLVAVQRRYHDAARRAVAEIHAIAADRSHYNHLLSVLHQELAAAKETAAEAARLEAAQAAAQPAAGSTLPGQSFPAPPPNSKANIAVDTALSFLGIPYCWGGASRSCVDCSGLTMLSWDAAGVYLPHYSGAQMADSTPVPTPAGDPTEFLEPGDLLFYGPGGSDHVAMYIGNGEMIQAPYTGAVVDIVPADFSSWFAGAGRP